MKNQIGTLKQPPETIYNNYGLYPIARLHDLFNLSLLSELCKPFLSACLINVAN